MATYNLDQTTFQSTLANFDATTQNQILQYLNSQGIYTWPGATARVQYQPPPPGGASVPPIDTGQGTQIAEFTPASFGVTTDSIATINAVIATGNNINVSMAGSENVLLASGNGNDILTDSSAGNDEIVAGAGNDSLTANGTGNDTVYGGAGNDTIVASGTGRTLVLDGGAGKTSATGDNAIYDSNSDGTTRCTVVSAAATTRSLRPGPAIPLCWTQAARPEAATCSQVVPAMTPLSAAAVMIR